MTARSNMRTRWIIALREGSVNAPKVGILCNRHDKHLRGDVWVGIPALYTKTRARTSSGTYSRKQPTAIPASCGLNVRNYPMNFNWNWKRTNPSVCKGRKKSAKRHWPMRMYSRLVAGKVKYPTFSKRLYPVLRQSRVFRTLEKALQLLSKGTGPISPFLLDEDPMKSLFKIRQVHLED